MIPLNEYVISKPMWSFFTQARTFLLRSSSRDSLASHRLSYTHMFMCERFVCSHALPLYQGSMSPVERIGRSVSNTGSSVRAFSKRISSQMCCTTFVMFSVMTILLRLSSSLNSGGSTTTLPVSM